MLKSKILIALVVVLTFAIAFGGIKSRAEAHSVYTCSDMHFEFGNYELLNLGNSPKYRCKICSRTFRTGIMVAGHIKGEHHKFFIHRYYEKI